MDGNERTSKKQGAISFSSRNLSVWAGLFALALSLASCAPELTGSRKQKSSQQNLENIPGGGGGPAPGSGGVYVGAAGAISQALSKVVATPVLLQPNNSDQGYITVTVVDSLGNVLPGVNLQIRSDRAASDDTFDKVIRTTGGSGQALFKVRSKKVGKPRLLIDVVDNVGIPVFTLTQSAQVEFISSAASPKDSEVKVVTMGPYKVGPSKINVEVTLKDAAGNPVAGKQVLLRSSRNNPPKSPDVIKVVRGVTDAQGVALYTVQSEVTGQAVITATNFTDSIALTQQPKLDFVPERVSTSKSIVTVVTPGSARADGVEAITVEVQLKDKFGNFVPDKTVTLSTDRASGTDQWVHLNPATPLSDVNGLVSFYIRSKKSINYEDPAPTTAAPNPLPSPVPAHVTPIVDDAGAITLAAKPIVFTPGPVSATESKVESDFATRKADNTEEATLTVTLKDQYGNPVPDEAFDLNAIFPTFLEFTPAPTSGALPIGVKTKAAGNAFIKVKTTAASAGTTIPTRFWVTVPTVPVITKVRTPVTFTGGTPSNLNSTIKLIDPPDPSTLTADGLEIVVLEITALDDNSAPIVGATITPSPLSGVVIQSLPTAGQPLVTGPTGKVRIQASTTRAGLYSFGAAVGSVLMANTESVEFFPGPISTTLSSIKAFPKRIAKAGACLQIQIEAKDAQGNPIPDRAVELFSSRNDPDLPVVDAITLLGAAGAAITDASGNIGFSVCGSAIGRPFIVAKITEPDPGILGDTRVISLPDLALSGVTSFDLTFTAGTPVQQYSQIQVSAIPAMPPRADGLEKLRFKITARDVVQQLVAGEAVTLTFFGKNCSGACSPPTFLVVPPAANFETNSVGEAFIDVTTTLADQYVVTVDVGGNVIGNQTVDFVSGPPDTSKSIVQACSQEMSADGTDAILLVLLRDKFENPVASTPVSLGIGGIFPTAIVAPGPSVISGVGGDAIFRINTTNIGTMTFNVDSMGIPLYASTSSNVRFKAGPVDLLKSSLTATPSMAVADDLQEIRVSAALKDQYGNPVDGVAVGLEGLVKQRKSSGPLKIRTLNATTAPSVPSFTWAYGIPGAWTTYCIAQAAVPNFTSGTPKVLGDYGEIMYSDGAGNASIAVSSNATVLPKTTFKALVDSKFELPQKADLTFTLPPSITGFIPTEGLLNGLTRVGASTRQKITISGIGFPPAGVTPAPSVTVGGVACQPSAWDSTFIDCELVSGVASPGLGAVVVTIPATGASVDSTAVIPPLSVSKFKFFGEPEIAAISPRMGPHIGGTVLTLTGVRDFAGDDPLTPQMEPAVTIAGVPCQVTSVSGKGVKCTTGDASQALVIGLRFVTITDRFGQTQSSTAAERFKYIYPPRLVGVRGPASSGTGSGSDSGSGSGTGTGTGTGTGSGTGSDPSQTPPLPKISRHGGEEIVLLGANFLPLPDTAVKVGDADCVIQFINYPAPPAEGEALPEEIHCKTEPGLQLGTAQVVITSLTAPPAVGSGLGFDVTLGISAYKVTPDHGPVVGGIKLTIEGEEYDNGATVSVGGTPCSPVNFVSDRKIECPLPVGTTTGLVPVKVTNPDGEVSTKQWGFTYDGPPVLTAIDPPMGRQVGNSLVTITGSEFADPVEVKFGGVVCGGATVNSTHDQITCTTGTSLVTGLVDVVVRNADQQVSTLASAYEYRPAISQSGGETITIYGNGFSSATPPIVQITNGTESLECLPTSVTNLAGTLQSVTCVTEPGALLGQASVTVSSGTYLYPDFDVARGVAIIGVSPLHGPMLGGVTLTISGAEIQANASVTLGGNPCAVVDYSAVPITLQCTLPMVSTLPTAKDDITIVNPDGARTTKHAVFNYDPPPSVISVNLAKGSSIGGTTLAIQGTDFVGSSVKVGGVSCGVTSVSPTSINCVTQDSAVYGTQVDIEVTNSDKQSGVLANSFTYVGPAITSVTPAEVIDLGGEEISVIGTGFKSVASEIEVKVGGVPCTVSSVSPVSPSTTPPSQKIKCGTGASSVLGRVTLEVTNLPLRQTALLIPPALPHPAPLSYVASGPSSTASLVLASNKKAPADGSTTVQLIAIPRYGGGAPMGPGMDIRFYKLSEFGTLGQGNTLGNPSANPPTGCTGLGCSVVATDLGDGSYLAYLQSSDAGAIEIRAMLTGGTSEVPLGSQNPVVEFIDTFTTVPGGTTISSAWPAAADREVLVMSGGATFDASTEGLTYGDIYVKGGTITHTASSDLVMRKLDIKLTGGLRMIAGDIDVSGKGYTGANVAPMQKYSYGELAPSTLLAGHSTSGGSHAGTGGKAGAGKTYGNYRAPAFAGSGGLVGNGGGVVRIQAAQLCTFDRGTRILAYGQNTAAGGSISLVCGGFTSLSTQGTGYASHLYSDRISANGGNIYGTYNSNTGWSATAGAGGGGRVALVSTGDRETFLGDFKIPQNFADFSSFRNLILARGGLGDYPGKPSGSYNFSDSTYVGGAGTVFLSHSKAPDGILIVDNGGTNSSQTTAGKTALVSATGTLLSVGSSPEFEFSPALGSGEGGILKGATLRPALSALNGAGNADWLKDARVEIQGNSGDKIRYTGGNSEDISSIGKSFRSIDVLDYLVVDGGASVISNGDIYVRTPSLLNSLASYLEISNSVVEFNGFASFYRPVDYLFNSTFTAGRVAARSVTISGAAQFTVASIDATQDVTIGGGVTTANSISAKARLTIETGKLTHPATGSGAVQSLKLNAGELVMRLAGSINADEKGFAAGYSYGVSGASSLFGAGPSQGGSHGGRGGDTAATPLSGPTYGDYRNPQFPGAGGPTIRGGIGGGVVDIKVTGDCTIGDSAKISANGGLGAAGGSITLDCGISLKGMSPKTEVVQANGGAFPYIYSNALGNIAASGCGGGGRIALKTGGAGSDFADDFTVPSARNSPFYTKVQARGGDGIYWQSNYVWPGFVTRDEYNGGAGTVYVQHSGVPNGILIVDNGGHAPRSGVGRTTLRSLAGKFSGTTTASGTAVPVTSVLGLTSASSSGYGKVFEGVKIRASVAPPNVSGPNANGTYTGSSDPAQFLTITDNSSSDLKLRGNLGLVVSGANFRSIDVLDYLEVRGGAALETYGDIQLTSGTLGSPSAAASRYEIYEGALILRGEAATNRLPKLNLSSGRYDLDLLRVDALEISGSTYLPIPSLKLSGDLDIFGGQIVTTGLEVLGKITQTTGTLTADTAKVSGDISISGGTVTANGIEASGDLILSGGAINTSRVQVGKKLGMSAGKISLPASASSAIRRLRIDVSGKLEMTGTASVDATGAGFPSNKNTFFFNPATQQVEGATTWGGSISAGGSHGGTGGTLALTEFPGTVYDDYRAPIYPGGGGRYGAGGGVIQITGLDECAISDSAQILANGINTAAGGSVQLRCKTLKGTSLVAGTIQANGGAERYNPGWSNNAGAGGGGRVALITTDPVGREAFQGDFEFPQFTPQLAKIKQSVQALGGASGNGLDGGAGSVYIRYAGLNYGALIFDNGGRNTGPLAGRTQLISIAGELLTDGIASKPNLETDQTSLILNLFVGMEMRPSLSFDNATTGNLHWFDDNVVRVKTNGGSDFEVEAADPGATVNWNAIAGGEQFRSIDRLDFLEISGNAVIGSLGDIWVKHASMTDPGRNYFEFENGVAQSSQGGLGSGINWAMKVRFNTGTYDLANLEAAGLMIDGPSVNITAKNCSSTGLVSIVAGTVNCGTFSTTGADINMVGGRLVTQSLDVDGSLFVQNATLTHSPTTSSQVNRLMVSVKNDFTLGAGGHVDVNGLGYLGGTPRYSYGLTGPSTSFASATGTGGSHGGQGGTYTGYGFSESRTYDDYREPKLPGGGSHYASGGGVFHLVTQQGKCTMESGSWIRANGADYGGAGGSIALDCKQGFEGSPDANSIQANGGSYYQWGNSIGGGGGGRIALVSGQGEASFKWAGIDYPSSATKYSKFKDSVQVRGGSINEASGGGAGTIFIKHSELEFGDLLVDNGGAVGGGSTGKTQLVSMRGRFLSDPGPNRNVGISDGFEQFTFSPGITAAYDDLLAGVWLRPDVDSPHIEWSESDWSTHQIHRVTNNGSSEFVLQRYDGAQKKFIDEVGDLVVADKNFRTIEVLDHMEIGGGAWVVSHGDVYLKNGGFLGGTSADGVTTLSNGVISFTGYSKTNSKLAFNLSQGRYVFEKLPLQRLQIFGTADVSASEVTVKENLTLSNTGKLSVEKLRVDGSLNASGSSLLTHPSTDATTVRKLEVTIGQNLLLEGQAKISANDLGYPAQNGTFQHRSFGSTGPSTSLAGSVDSGGSHGGEGGNRGNSGLTFDDYRDPSLPGGSGYNYSGGGVIRMIAAGSCALKEGVIISADSTNSSAYSGAGGSVLIKCSSIAGDLITGRISANGATGYTWAGGGGRVALITTGSNGATDFSGAFEYPNATTLPKWKATVFARGGTGGSGHGGAGTVFIKHSGEENGFLLVDNGGTHANGGAGRTLLVSMAGTVSGSNSNTEFPITVQSGPVLSTAHTNLYAGMRVRPDVSADFGTVNDWTDDVKFIVSSNDQLKLVTEGVELGTDYDGKIFRSIDILDGLEVSGGGSLATYGDLFVKNVSQKKFINGMVENLGTVTLKGAMNFESEFELTAGAFSMNRLAATQLSLGGSVALTAPEVAIADNLVITGGTLTSERVSVAGNLTMSGGTITQIPTETSTTRRLEIILDNGNFTLTGGTIDVSAKGYVYGALGKTSFGATAPATALAGDYYSGGSHGGKPGKYYSEGPTFDDYRDPSYPGGSGGGGVGANGGGVVRITALGNGKKCSINGGRILANATTYYYNTSGAAGGSVLIRCSKLDGTATGAGVIEALGGAAEYGRGGGGGGRIALIAMGPAAASELSGIFAYPSNLADSEAMATRFSAKGGISYGGGYLGGVGSVHGGAGTLFINHSGHEYGTLIVNNGAIAPTPQVGRTSLRGFTGTVHSVEGVRELRVNLSPTLSSAYSDFYKDVLFRIAPIVPATSDADWNIAELQGVRSNNDTSFETRNDLSESVQGEQVIRSIDVLDQLFVSNGAFVETRGDIYVMDHGSNGRIKLAGGDIQLLNGGEINLLKELEFSSGSYAFDTLKVAALEVKGTASVSATTLEVTEDLHLRDTASLETQNLTVGRDFTATGGVLSHPATDTGTLRRLVMNIGRDFTLTGGSVNVSGRGYPGTYHFFQQGKYVAGVSGNPAIGTASLSGGNHGGQGGEHNNWIVADVFDSHVDPQYPGGGAGSAGGGVVLITATRNCRINQPSLISANGADSSYSSGAGGTINMKCAAFAGDVTASASPILQASGGIHYGYYRYYDYYYNNVYYGGGAGGGGRIALSSTGDTSSFSGLFDYSPNQVSRFKNMVLAKGGIVSYGYNGYSNLKAGAGAAGTIYLKTSDQTYGSLIVHNGDMETTSDAKTRIVAVHVNIDQGTPHLYQSFGDYQADAWVSPSQAFPSMISYFTGLVMHVFDMNDVTAAVDPRASDVRKRIVMGSNSANRFVASSSIAGNQFPTISNYSHGYRFVVELDRLEVSGRGKLHLNGSDLLLGNEGGCDLHNTDPRVFEVPTNSTLHVNAIGTQTCDTFSDTNAGSLQSIIAPAGIFSPE